MNRRDERPFIVCFQNQDSTTGSFDVVVKHEDCSEASRWTREYFSLYIVEYKDSDFDHTHTYHCELRNKNANR